MIKQVYTGQSLGNMPLMAGFLREFAPQSLNDRADLFIEVRQSLEGLLRIFQEISSRLNSQEIHNRIPNKETNGLIPFSADLIAITQLLTQLTTNYPNDREQFSRIEETNRAAEMYFPTDTTNPLNNKVLFRGVNTNYWYLFDAMNSGQECFHIFQSENGDLALNEYIDAIFEFDIDEIESRGLGKVLLTQH